MKCHAIHKRVTLIGTRSADHLRRLDLTGFGIYRFYDGRRINANFAGFAPAPTGVLQAVAVCVHLEDVHVVRDCHDDEIVVACPNERAKALPRVSTRI